MPYKPTGKPPGRPKTNWYETLSARVPQDLAEQVRRYASRHRQTLSEVFRDGFTLLLQDDRYTPFMSDTNRVPEIASDTNGSPEMVSDTITTALGIVSDTKNTSESLADALHRQRLREIVSDTNETPEMVSDMNGAHPVLLDAADLDAMPSASVAISQQPAEPALDYDQTKYVLGKLCPRGHEWGTTGQSLLQQSNHKCLICHREQGRQRRERQAPRQAGKVDAPAMATPAPAVSPRGSVVRDKAIVLAQLHAWKAAGVSLQTMADRLNTSEVATFSGKGSWKKGTIFNLLAPRPAPVA